MKKYGVAIFLFLGLGIVVGYLLSSGRPQPTAPQEEPVIVVDPPPRTVEFPQLPAGAIFSYDGPKKEFPASLMAYHVAPTASSRTQVEAFSLALAPKFGFEGSPSAFWRSGAFAATWDTEPASLSVSFSKDVLSFSLSQRRVSPSALRTVSPDAIIAALSSIITYPAGATLRPLEQRTGGFDGVVVLDSPGPLTGYSFGLSILDIPVLTSEYLQQWASAVADSGGVVRVLSAIVPFRSLTPAGEVALISLADAIANMNAGRGAVLWITDETAPPGYGTTPTITNAVVHDAELVYVAVGETLRPAYLLAGSGEQSTVVQSFEALVFASPL